ncbi:MAG: DoxX family protein [Bacteroidales bacterium]|nr:DoxX family protein [Bacteroidales bacterium]
MKYLLLRLKRFCGFIAGIVFFIAGIFKLLDPVGAGLAMREYLDFFHIDFLAGLAKPMAAVLAFAETLIGAALVTGIWRRLTAVAALIFQIFFTILTLILVIFNPEMDCGCFGEAIHLTHLETFIKNIILLILLLMFAFPFRHLGGPKKHKYVSFGVVMASVLAFSVYTWINIPFVDYTDFKPAVALQAGSAFGPSEEVTFEAVFIYEKDGEVKEFGLDALPDSTWNFVETKTVFKEVDKAVNLSFYDEYGLYQDTLAVKGKVMIMSLYDIDVKPSVWKKVVQFTDLASSIGFRPLLLVAASAGQMEKVYAEFPEYADVLKPILYHSDYKTLITMNRSNGGVTYFSDGYLVRKWPFRACPGEEDLNDIYIGDDTETIIGASTVGSLAFQGFLLYVFALMLLL